MVKLIMGLKGTGKTKKLIDAMQEAVRTANGDVVCIEKGKKLTYDLPHKIRLVDAEEYGIVNADLLKGLVSGLHAGNFDITHVYIDGLYKIVGKDVAAAEAFVTWCDRFAEVNCMNITISLSEAPEALSDEMKKYL